MDENTKDTLTIRFKNLPMDITEFEKDLEPALDFFERLKKFSTWMTTIAFASLGFYITILFQIKSNSFIPNKGLSILTYILLIISILFGLYYRFKHEMNKFAYDFRTVARVISKIFHNVIDENSEDGARALEILGKGFEEKIKNITAKSLKPIRPWSLCMQMATLALGLIMFGIYISFYLF
jgi:uncharacterized protein involved in cysteine biosynthesis